MAQVLGFIGPLLSAFGVGAEFFGGQASAKKQEELAMLNFQIQQDQFNFQRESSSMQSQIQQQIASNEKAALERNAVTLEQQANVATTAGRENARRTREDYARMLAAQRAQIAKAGVVDTTGSPLSLLAATAEQEQRAVDELAFQTEGQRRQLFREADNQRAVAFNAGLDIYSAQAQAGAAKLQAQNALTEANFNMIDQFEQAKAKKRSTWVQLIQGLGSMFSGGSQNYGQTGNVWGNSEAGAQGNPYAIYKTPRSARY